MRERDLSSGAWDLVDAPLTDSTGAPILVPHRFSRKTGLQTATARPKKAIPDAVNFARRVIKDYKSIDRGDKKLRSLERLTINEFNQMMGYVQAFKQSQGVRPDWIIISYIDRWDPNRREEMHLYRVCDHKPWLQHVDQKEWPAHLSDLLRPRR